MDMFSNTVSFFQNGGVFMYPIVIVFALGLAISIERYIYLSKTSLSNRMVWKRITPFIQAGKFQDAVSVTAKSKSAIGTILTYGLHRIKAASRRDDVEKAMEESLMEVMPRLEKRTHYLATIIGLIRAFTAVSAANPAEKADLLSASISVAMNTTAFGLMVAIPLLLIHTVLQSKTTEIVDSLEMVSVKFLNAVDERRQQAQVA